MITDELLSNPDGIPYTTQFGEGGPVERIVEILSFQSPTRTMEMRMSETGKVVITTTTTTGEDYAISMSPESYAAMVVLVLRMEARRQTLGKNKPDMGAVRFGDARSEVKP